MVSYCQSEGVNSFFVVGVDMTEVNTYEIDMLYNNFVEGIIQPEFRSIDGEMLLYNKINGMKSLKDIMAANTLTGKQTLMIMEAVCNAVIEAGEYMLEPDSLMMKSDYIFSCVSVDECRFVYAPGVRKDIKKQIRSLVEELIRHIDHMDGKLVDFMYNVYEIVVIDNFDIEALSEMVHEMQSRFTRGSGPARIDTGRYKGYKANNGSYRSYGEQEKLKDMLFGSGTLGREAEEIDIGEESTKSGEKSLSNSREKNEINDERNKLSIVFAMLIIAVLTVGTGMVIYQLVCYGGVRNVRILMLMVAMAAVFLFLHLEFSKKGESQKCVKKEMIAGQESTEGQHMAVTDGNTKRATGTIESMKTIEPARMKEPTEMIEKKDMMKTIKENCCDEEIKTSFIASGCSTYPDGICYGTQVLSSSDNDTTLLVGKTSENDRGSRLTLELRESMSGEKIDIDVTDNGTVIGREGVADIVLNDRSISRRHAMFSEKNNRIYVKDLGSTNGTFVNEIKLCHDKYWPLSDGDVFRVGGMEYTVQILLT